MMLHAFLGGGSMRAFTTIFAPLFVAALASCGGGGGGSAPASPPPVAYALSGSIGVIGDSLVDSDVNDPLTARVSNDDPGAQQPLQNPATLGGYANEAGAGPAGPSFTPGDEFDGYAVPLAANQNVNLFIAEPSAGDLDLFLLDADLNIVDSSEGIGQDETVTAPAEGAYTVLVYAFSGASNYVLQIGAGMASASHGLRYGAEFVPGEIQAQFIEPAGGPGARPAAARALELGLEARGGAPGRTMLFGLPAAGIPAALGAAPARSHGWHRHLRPFDAKRVTLRAIKGLLARTGVAFAEPNLIRRALAVPGDTLYAQQWHYSLINLPLAWDVTQGSADVIVAVVDTGVVLAHPDLSGQFDPQDPNGFDFISSVAVARDGNGRDQNADDPGDGSLPGASSFHGTHVAGTVAAATNNGAGVAGAGWNTRIMPLRVLGEGGGTSFDIQQAVLYAAGLPNDTGLVPANPADVINLSLGGSGSSNAEQQVYTQVINAGVLVAAAAGNDGTSRLSYPASYNGVVSVASVGRAKQRAYYSQFNAAVDVAAPGGDQSTSSRDGVLSTHATDSSGAVVSTYSYLQGTSMATPHVAAVMALMRAAHPGLTQQDFLNLLASGAITEDLGAAGRDNSFGYGLLDARLAVTAAADLAGGAPPAEDPVLASSSGSLQFGAALQTLLFDLGNAGGGSLEVTSVAGDQSWLDVVADSVRSDGTGRYRATVSRAGLAEGLHQGTVTIVSTANTLSLPVTLQVSAALGAADAGYTYVLLIDGATFEPVDQFDGATASGALAYTFTGVAAGSYFIVAGSDQNNDGFICDSGESCGAFPTLDAFEAVEVTANRSGLDFLSGFSFGVNAGAGAQEAASVPAGATGRRWQRLR